MSQDAVILIPTLPLFILSLVFFAVDLALFAYYLRFLRPERDAWEKVSKDWEQSLLDDMADQETKAEIKCIPPHHVDHYKTQRVPAPGSKWR